MALNKLRKFNDGSYGVVLPKDDLRLDGLLDDEDGDLDGEHHVHVQREESGKWELQLVEDL
jgi:hypothetical protein